MRPGARTDLPTIAFAADIGGQLLNINRHQVFRAAIGTEFQRTPAGYLAACPGRCQLGLDFFGRQDCQLAVRHVERAAEFQKRDVMHVGIVRIVTGMHEQLGYAAAFRIKFTIAARTQGQRRRGVFVTLTPAMRRRQHPLLIDQRSTAILNFRACVIQPDDKRPVACLGAIAVHDPQGRLIGLGIDAFHLRLRDHRAGHP